MTSLAPLSSTENVFKQLYILKFFLTHQNYYPLYCILPSFGMPTLMYSTTSVKLLFSNFKIHSEYLTLSKFTSLSDSNQY